MYSGHVHAMAGMYDVLFNEDRYERPRSLSMQRDRMWATIPRISTTASFSG